ncbi:hypothetical protein J437_LFUL007963 [Ladona fulva]|uniref:Uncharacterized protein n=1 Tax=Ladona fulva TaxID=123851 RepID=A0A8K0KCR8_LADFU|nr:hypothetical protein J437_LFUL007963 [Ladona fulva]
MIEELPITSTILSCRSRAVPSADGSHYILNGSKIWISNGSLAEVMTVFAQTPVKDEKTGVEKDKVTAFIVQRSFGGVTSGPPEKKMGIKCSNTAEVYYDNVKIPAENVLGGVGQGFKVAMNILNNGRFGMAAALAGTMRAVTAKAVEFANQRTQFGRTINSFGTIQEKLARMSLLHYVTESMAYMLSSNMDRGSTEYHLEAAISKFAGGHLRELQKAFKNPTANLGLILEEATKRGLRSVGLASPPSLSEFVHPSLSSGAQLAAKSIESFGIAVEHVLVKHGRGVVEEQFLLNRLAQAAIDTFTMAVVLSRASHSLSKNLPSAHHEQLLASVWCNEASERVKRNLGELTSPMHLENYSKLSLIAKNMCEAEGMVQGNPLGL